MAEQVCPKCDQLFKHGDKVKAVIITNYVALKSKAVYALEKPTDCKWLEHVWCGETSPGD